MSDFSKGGYTRLAEYRSESNPSKWYIVAVQALNDGTVQMTCDCLGWRFAKKEGAKAKGCKHVRAFRDGTVALSNVKITPSGQAWMAARRAGAGKTRQG